MERKQFTFYRSFFDAVSRIRDKTARADAYDAICAYALSGAEPDLDQMSDAAAIAYISAKPNLDASREKAERGQAGGSKPKADRKQTGSNQKASPADAASKKEIEIEKEIEYECISPHTPHGGRKGSEPKRKPREADFELFWAAYPKKVGKQAAKKAFDRVKAPVETLLTALERQKRSDQWSRDAGQYIPNPSTWLNQGRWEDELPEANTARNGVPMGSGELGAAELEAIRRVLSDDIGGEVAV